MRENYHVYIDDIVAICRRENVPKLQPFKEELIKKYKATKPNTTRALSKLLEFLRDLSSLYKDCGQSSNHLPISAEYNYMIVAIMPIESMLTQLFASTSLFIPAPQNN